MGCRICGRSSCTESFHSLAEQELAEKPLRDLLGTIEELEAECDALRKLFTDVGGDEHDVLALVTLWSDEVHELRAELSAEKLKCDNCDALNEEIAASTAAQERIKALEEEAR